MAIGDNGGPHRLLLSGRDVGRPQTGTALEKALKSGQSGAYQNGSGGAGGPQDGKR